MKLNTTMPIISSLSSAQEHKRESSRLALADTLSPGAMLYFDRKQANKSILYFRVFCVKNNKVVFLTQTIITVLAIELWATLGDKVPLLIVHHEDELQSIAASISDLLGVKVTYSVI